MTLNARDHRLDFFRGLALLTIFVNHVPGNLLENYTSRNFGFSDAAEAFVLMAGMAASLAYSRGFAAGGTLRTTARIWRRAVKLYAVHVAITLAALVVLFCGLESFGETRVFNSVNASPFLTDPTRALAGVFALGHQLGYFNILPLYVVLLATAPFFFLVGRRSPRLLFFGSATVWLLAGLSGTNLPNWPVSGQWFLDPLSWQFLFVIGLCCGMAAKEGRRALPVHRALVAVSAFYALYALVVVKWQLWGYVSLPSIPSVIGGYDKSYLSAFRLLHVLALAYLVSCSPLARHIASSALAAPISYLGRNSLPVFAAGSVICIVLQVSRSISPTSVPADIALIFLGVGLQYLAAWLSNWKPAGSRAEALAATA